MVAVAEPAAKVVAPVCGVKSFYIPRSHPEGISVNARCIDSDTVEGMSVEPFDGRDWEKGMIGYRDARDA